MFGGLATICPECSSQWTLSPAVSISWFCPRCGGASDEKTVRNPCQCGHIYGEHDVRREVKPSRAAFGISAAELNKVEEILAIKPEPPPRLGHCKACNCRHYELEPPLISAAQFLDAVDAAARHGARGRGMNVTKMDDGALRFANGKRSVSLHIETGDSIVMDFGTDNPSAREFVMGRDTVGGTIIAIHDVLERTGSG